jgi:hypothetical protein
MENLHPEDQEEIARANDAIARVRIPGEVARHSGMISPTIPI